MTESLNTNSRITHPMSQYSPDTIETISLIIGWVMGSLRKVHFVGQLNYRFMEIFRICKFIAMTFCIFSKYGLVLSKDIIFGL